MKHSSQGQNDSLYSFTPLLIHCTAREAIKREMEKIVREKTEKINKWF